MLLLLVVSVASWAAIFRKLFALRRVSTLNDDFEREFWSGTSLNDLYSAAAQNAAGRPDGAHLRHRHARVPEAARAPHRRRHRCSTARAAPCAPASSASSTRWRPTSPSSPRWLGVALRRPVRHRLGHHACLHRPGEPAAGDAGHRGARHRRGAGRHRDRPVRRHPGGGRLQPLRARHRPHRHPAGDLHRGVLQHPAAQRRRSQRATDGAGPPRHAAAMPRPRPRAAAPSTRSTWSRSST